jgi:hypothetical protein
MDKNNVLWISGWGSVKRDGWTFGYFNQDHIVQMRDDPMPVYATCIDDEGVFWLFQLGRLLIRYDGDTFTNFYSELLPGYSQAAELVVDPVGNKWINSANKLIRFDGEEFKAYTHPGLQKNILCIAADSNGDIWMGTDGSDDPYEAVRLFRYSAEQDAIVEVALNTSGIGGASVSKIQIFPNPAQDFITITNAAGKDLVVYDNLGRRFLEQEIVSDTENIAVSSWSKGIYFVRTAKNGNDSGVIKLIKR